MSASGSAANVSASRPSSSTRGPSAAWSGRTSASSSATSNCSNLASASSAWSMEAMAVAAGADAWCSSPSATAAASRRERLAARDFISKSYLESPSDAETLSKSTPDGSELDDGSLPADIVSLYQLMAGVYV